MGILFPVLGYGRDAAGILPAQLTCEYLANPSVIDDPNPRLSWINEALPDVFGQRQTAWQVGVASSAEKLASGDFDCWDTGKIRSDRSILIRYEGKLLESGKTYWWRVRVWDAKGKVSRWSEPACWHMGLLSPADWQARWIGAPWEGENADPSEVSPAPLFRKTFRPAKKVVSAWIYTTGVGYFQLYCNGEKVSDDVLVPNQTNYGKRDGLGKIGLGVEDRFSDYRVLYLAYDLTHLLNEHENVIGVLLGNGFYNTKHPWASVYYGTSRFIGQLHLVYTDGTQEIIGTGSDWKAAESGIRYHSVFGGEHYDARCEQPGWCGAGFDDSLWRSAVLRQAPDGRMEAQQSHPDRVMETLSPVAITCLGEGHYKVDFGEEISGWVRLHGITGDAGRRIDVKYLSESPNGSASYTMNGAAGGESYAPCFTWFVFREVEISGWPGEIRPGQLTAEAVYTAMSETGKFECSNELFNRIDRIWWRSQTDNLHGGIPSDCPHRERAPYTGDGQVACVTVMHRLDAAAFYTKWMRDILGAQDPQTGYVPNAAPWLTWCGGGVPWGAAVSVIPWEFYLHYGDRDMLAACFDGMKKHLNYLSDHWADDGILFSQIAKDGQVSYWLNLGEWCSPGKMPSDTLVHTFYYWQCADHVARAARVLGKEEEAERYFRLAEQIKTAFHNRFYDPVAGTYGPYGANIFALCMGVPDDEKDRVVASLRRDVLAAGGHLDTGIFGTRFFFEVLAANGLNELAYEAMNKRDFPGYGYWIEQGATTTWEQWDGKNSRNHPMFGGGLTWFYRDLAGMGTDPDRPGYRHIVFRPQPVGDVAYARYETRTPYGNASIYWTKQDGPFRMEIRIPVGCTATVFVPLNSSGGLDRRMPRTVKLKGISDDYAEYEVSGSGFYRF